MSDNELLNIKLDPPALTPPGAQRDPAYDAITEKANNGEYDNHWTAVLRAPGNRKQTILAALGRSNRTRYEVIVRKAMNVPGIETPVGENDLIHFVKVYAPQVRTNQESININDNTININDIK